MHLSMEAIISLWCSALGQEEQKKRSKHSNDKIKNSWIAANIDDPQMDKYRLISIYLLVGVLSTVVLLARTLVTVVMGMQVSRASFGHLLISLFRAPMTFYDSTPFGRILSRVSSNMSIVDIDVPFHLVFTVGSTKNCYANVAVLAVMT